MLNKEAETYLKEGLENENIILKHYIKRLSSYNANVVCCQFESEKALSNGWEEIMNNVAQEIQDNVDKYIEMYNIYIFYFVNDENLDVNLIHEIEQSKYSSRKIVIKQLMPGDADLLALINNKLFSFELSPIKIAQSVEDILDKNFIDFIKRDIQFDSDEAVEQFLLMVDGER